MSAELRSDGARLVLLELEAPPATPIGAAGLAAVLVTFTSRQVGAWLRELHVAGLAEPLDACTGERIVGRVQAGTRTLWRSTRSS